MQGKIFKTPFSMQYWACAAEEFKNFKKIVVAALFVSMAVSLSSIKIPVMWSQNLFVMATFLITATGTVIYGPCVGMVAAAALDVLAWMIFESAAYPFFVGYAVSEILCALIYSAFLYRSKITVLRLFLARLTVNIFVNTMLGSLWSEILFGKGYYYFLSKSFIKNISLIIPEIVLLYMVMQALVPVAVKIGLVPRGAIDESGIIRWG